MILENLTIYNYVYMYILYYNQSCLDQLTKSLNLLKNYKKIIMMIERLNKKTI